MVGNGSVAWDSPGLAYDPNNDVLYGMHLANDALYSINTSTGAATFIGDSGTDNLPGLAYDPNNNILYATSGATDKLYTLNISTGAKTEVGALGVNVSNNGLAYDWDSDVLYLNDDSTDALYTVNVGTGAATLVGANGVNGIIGLTYIPEPSSALLLSLGSALFLLRRKSRS